MAQERIPNDPYRANRADDPYRTRDPIRDLNDDETRRQARLDNEFQVDPELAEGPASSGRIAMFAVAIALVLGAVFYGLNNSSINQAGTSPVAQNAAPSSPPAAPPGMRDVTPRAPNTEPGTTTGAAPMQTPVGPPTSGANIGAPDNK